MTVSYSCRVCSACSENKYNNGLFGAAYLQCCMPPSEVCKCKTKQATSRMRSTSCLFKPPLWSKRPVWFGGVCLGSVYSYTIPNHGGCHQRKTKSHARSQTTVAMWLFGCFKLHVLATWCAEKPNALSKWQTTQPFHSFIARKQTKAWNAHAIETRTHSFTYIRGEKTYTYTCFSGSPANHRSGLAFRSRSRARFLLTSTYS